uniref:Ubiquinol-cytochrome c reductase complex assembly factor 6 n=1 Tax=Dicentrarchus labrax TaxID=13489 RepID=A0A8P4K7I9_DICLA
MPAGVSWPQYLRMFSASLLSMFAGAQVVHQYYLPDLSIPEVPPKPGELKTELWTDGELYILCMMDTQPSRLCPTA